MSAPYREQGGVPHLEEIPAALARIEKQTKEPRFVGDNAYWLAFWTRAPWGFAATLLVALWFGRSCNANDNAARVEVSKAEATKCSVELVKK